MTAPIDSSPTPASASLAEDFIDIWFSPSAVFARRAKAGALGPFLISSLLLVALFYAAMGAMQGIFDAELARAIAEARADNPSMTDEQVGQMQGIMEASIRWGGLIAMPIVLLLLGGLTWLVARILGGAIGFGGGVMIASFAYLPKALELLLVLVQSFVLDASSVSGRYGYSFGVGRLLDPATTSQGIYNLAGRVDLFTFWVTALIVLGLIHAAKVERSKAIAGGIGIWLLGALPALFQLIGGE